MTDEISNAVLLKRLDEINAPDERSSFYSRVDELGF
jgi:hypothetical protein